MTRFLTPDCPIPPYMAFPRFLLDQVNLSETAKILYTLLLDRARLSQKNDGWTDGQGHGGSHLDASVIKLIWNYDGQIIVLRDKELDPSEGSGIYGSDLYLKYLNATVTFSMPLVSNVEVLIESWDYSSSYTVALNAADSITFEVPDYPAHYTITASFQGSNGVYDVTFAFNIGDADSI